MNLLWCQVCTFYCRLRKKRYTILPEGTYLHIQQHIHQKDLNFCLTSYDYSKVIDKLGKNTNKEFNAVVVFRMRSSSTFQFVFGFNECLRNLFPRLINLRKFLLLYLGCGYMTFDLMTQMSSSHFLPHEDE